MGVLVLKWAVVMCIVNELLLWGSEKWLTTRTLSEVSATVHCFLKIHYQNSNMHPRRQVHNKLILSLLHTQMTFSYTKWHHWIGDVILIG